MKTDMNVKIGSYTKLCMQNKILAPKCKISKKDFRFRTSYIEKVDYSDDNTLAFFSKSLPDLVRVSENEADSALSWLEQNEMIANPRKFHALFVKKDQINTCCISLDFQGHSIKSKETFKLLGVTLDYKLNFDPYLSNLCKKATAQLNVLKRLKSFIGFAEKEAFVQSFVYPNC